MGDFIVKGRTTVGTRQGLILVIRGDDDGGESLRRFISEIREAEIASILNINLVTGGKNYG